MRRLLYILFCIAVAMPAGGFAQMQDSVSVSSVSSASFDSVATTGRKKVAVVLSGGGAKGVAHIGALRVIEQAGIPIDMIVGTSMGTIVGGLYAVGYTPDQLDSMVMTQDWNRLLSDRVARRDQPYSLKEVDDKYQISYPFGKKIEQPDGLIKGTNLEMLFNDLLVDYHDSLDFNTLPIPFACVAANIVDGTQKVFHGGVLPAAMRASMAIPGVFTPVYTDTEVLVDGGMFNNFPTDVARAMGADIVIGVDVSSALRTRDELARGAGDILGQIMTLAMARDTYLKNVALADVYVDVDVSGYSSASFNLPTLDTLMRRGEEATHGQWEALLEVGAGVGEDAGAGVPSPTPRERYVPLGERGDFRIYEVSFDELSDRQRKWVMRKCRLKEDSPANVASLNRSMEILATTSSYANIYYSLRDTLDGYNLHFHMDKLEGNSVSTGVEFDNEEIAAVLVNGTFRFGDKVPMEASITGRAGKRLKAQFDYTFLTSPLSGFKLNYTLSRNDINVNSGGKRDFNQTYNHHYAGFSFVNMGLLRQNLRMELGFAWQKYFYRRQLINTQVFVPNNSDKATVLSEGFVSYFARLNFETLDSRYFTMRGTSASVAAEVYTDNFYQYAGHIPFLAVSLSWQTAFPLSRRFSLIPSIYGRVLIGSDIPFPMLNMVGGKYFGRYSIGHLPFDGIGYMEAVPNAFVAARLQARGLIGRRHYVSASFNYAIADNNLHTLFAGKHYFGASLDYGYNFRLLPLMVSFNWSNITRSLGFYVQAGYMF